MDQPQSERDDARITLTPDMRPVTAEKAAPQTEARAEPVDRRPPRTSRLALLLALLGLLAGLAGLGAAFWIYTESQQDMRRMASDIAQLRVSLDLYARNANAAGTESTALTDLGNRLAILEQNWRGNAVPAPASAPPAAPDNADCLPSGMRILVAQGDSYPVCGQTASVDVTQVANGYIVLMDGTTIASGGTMPLPDTSCTIGVTSSGDEGLTGYAEIRVNC